MQKTELIDAVAKSTALPKATVEKVLKAILDNIASSLKKGLKVTLIGFGVFDIVKRAARTGRNPQNGKPIKIKASKSVKFKVGKKLKDEVNA